MMKQTKKEWNRMNTNDKYQLAAVTIMAGIFVGFIIFYGVQ